MIKEVWKKSNICDVEVSNFGNVRKDTKRGKRIIYQGNNKDGYKTIQIRKSGKRISYRVHRLVADAFLPNPHKKPVVNHIDGNKGNNIFSNLEWATVRENEMHKIHFLKPKTAKINMEIANEIRKCVASGKKYKELSIKYGICESDISYIVHNKKWVDESFSCSYDGHNTIFLSINGEKMSISDWSKKTGVPVSTIYGRYKKGIPMEKCIMPSGFFLKRKNTTVKP